MKKYLIIVLVALVTLGSAFAGLFYYTENLNKVLAKEREASKELDELTLGYYTQPSGLYPEAFQLEIYTFSLNLHMFEALTSFGPNLEIQPQLAESWENPNENTWRFRLRKNVKFHDGSDLTAEDVKATLDYLQTTETLSPIVTSIDKINVVDDYTVDVITKTPNPILINNLPYAMILDSEKVKNKDFKEENGTGPYLLKESSEDTFVLNRNEDYWGAKPKAKKVVIKVYGDLENIANALISGEADIVDGSGMEADKKAEILGAGNRLSSVETIDTSYIMLNSVVDSNQYINNGKENPLKDVRVRKAMSLAIDREELIKNIDAKANVQIVSPAVFGYNPELKSVKPDLKQAKSLLKEAGYENGFDVTFDLVTVRSKVAEVVKEQLGRVGIRVKTNLLPAVPESFGKLMSGELGMFFITWGATTGDAMDAYENILLSGASANPFKYSNKELDSLIEKTKSTFNQVKRKEYMKEMSEIVAREVPIIPLYSSRSHFYYGPKVDFNARVDTMIIGSEISGRMPEKLSKDYTLYTAFLNLVGIKK